MTDRDRTLPEFRSLSVRKSSSFRIIAFFTGCLVICGLAGVVWSGMRGIGQLESQMRATVLNERNEALADAGARNVDHLMSVTREFVRSEPGFYYLLQDKTQKVVVGNMYHLRPNAGWRMLSWTHRTSPPERRPVLGYGTILDDGGYLFVGMDGAPLRMLKRGLFTTFVWCGTSFLLIGLVGGFAMSRFLLGRIELISQTARDIMQGDLSRRLPSSDMDDEFNHLSASLNALFNRNETLLAQVSQVTDDIAHDMRRPLAHLARHLEKAEAAPMPPEGKIALEAARDSLEQAMEIFSSLLKLAQLEAHNNVPDAQPVHLEEVSKTLSDLYVPVIEHHGQHWRYSPASVPLWVMGNRVLLIQVLANLLENATLHTPVGTVISLSVRKEGNHALICVEDTGPGVPSEQRARVFDKMVRLDTSRHRTGTGIGLSLVRAVTRLHGGTISLGDNDPGLRCELRLPLVS